MTVPTTPAVAADGRLAPDDVLELRTLLGARLSPDGSQVVYAVSARSPDRREDRAQLYVVDVNSRISRQLTAPDGLDLGPDWHPNGETIVFRSTRQGTTQLFSVAAAGGEPELLARSKWGVGSIDPRVSPDGRHILFGAPANAPREPTEPYRVTSTWWRLDGVGLVRDAVQELFLVSPDGGDGEAITEHGALIIAAEWAPTADRILYLTLAEADCPTFVLRVWDAETGRSTTLWQADYEARPPVAAWRSDDRIVRSTANRIVVSGQRLQLVTTDATPGGPESLRTDAVNGWIFGLLQGDFEGLILDTPRIVVTEDGREAFVAVQVGGRLETWAVGLEGEPSARPIVQGNQANAPLDAKSGRVLLATASMYSPPDLWLVDQDGRNRRRLTALNEERFPEGARFDVRPLTVRGEDGTSVEAWFLSPHGADGPVPTLLTIHGGPHAGWGHTFGFDNCLLCDAGYGILLVNQRGSTGYSEAFSQAVHGSWGAQDASDLMCAVDVAVAEGLADPEALGVWGISGGGYLTGWLATRCGDCFRAAVAENGLFDWGSSWGSDMGLLFPTFLGETPSAKVPDASTCARQSVTTLLEDCTTPTLIIQHERDTRVPVANGDGLFTLLKLQGCTTEMLRMPRTSHDGSSMLGDPRTRVVQNEALLEWFDRYLKAAR